MRTLTSSALIVAAGLGLGCESFDAPPEPEIVGLVDGVLKDAKAPLVVDFGQPVDKPSLELMIVPYVVDAEGRLADEDDDPSTDITEGLLFQHTPRFGDFLGAGVFSKDAARFIITPDAPLPIGPRLALLVEPGLADTGGVKTHARRRLVFGYDADLTCNKPSKRFHSGLYFFLASVKTPIMTQVQLYASIVLDEASGAFIGQFTNADRNRTPGRCPMMCKSTEVCRLLPEPACAQPSDPAGTVDEFPDYLPNDKPPTGYSFTAHGCAIDQPDGSVVFDTAPVDVAVTQPAVTLRNVRLSASFRAEAGVLRATGSFAADSVLIGITPSGAASGDLTGRSLTEAEAPPGIPPPPKD
jgi:hypothetical protein